jgi:hypothetical protein
MKPLGARPLGRFARPRRRVRAGLLQLLCAVAGLLLGLLPGITVASTVASARVSDALVAVGFGVLGLVSIIFSLLFVVVQWAFSSLSPRLNLFRDDPIVWRTFAFAIGVFVFSVTTALVIGDQTKVSVIVPAAEVVAVTACSIATRQRNACSPRRGRNRLPCLYLDLTEIMNGAGLSAASAAPDPGGIRICWSGGAR